MSARSTQSAHERAGLRIAFAVATLIPGVAGACELRMGALVASPIAYDPFGTGTGEGSIRTTIDLVDGEDCEATVALVDDAAAPLRTIRFGDAARPVIYRIEFLPSDGVMAGLSPDMAIVRLSRDRPRVTILWRLLVDRDAVLAAGDYTLVVQSMLRAKGKAETPSARVPLLLRSIARAQANFAGTARGFAGGSSTQTIDLGTLATGEERSAVLQVRANTVAHLSVASENRGHLIMGDPGQARIAYGLAIEGTPTDLSVPFARTIAPPPTIDGIALELKVTVGDVTGKLAGRYSDTITIDVSP